MRDISKIKRAPNEKAGFIQAQALNSGPGRAPSDSAHGFTIIELMVAISMMVVIAGLFVVNLAGQRSNRSLNIAQNELVSNLRKIQSYTLSGRMLNNTQPIKYYIAKFDRSAAGSSGYTLQAMYQDGNNNWKLADMERVNFPAGVTLVPVTGIKIDNGNTVSTCALLAFQVPFAKMIMNDGCNIASPPSIQTGDSYQNILNFVFNSGSSPYTDKPMAMTIQYQNAGTRKVLINGITGMICPSTDGINCN